MRSRLAAIALALLWLAAPEAASACAVCTGGESDEVRYAFIWTTGFLSVLPLGIVGGVVWFLRRRARELAADRPASRPQPAAAPQLSRSSSSR